uniref:Uncharacterized protein n=1 Tax=viral metagenome TaxID=1070528 RepID=A0A6M3M3M9_9ZZZZ
MTLDKIGEGPRWIDQLVRFYAKIVEDPNISTENLDKANDAILECIDKLRPLTGIYKCDSLCIHYMNKDCITEENEGDGNCDRPDEYREVGDLADALNDEALFK